MLQRKLLLALAVVVAAVVLAALAALQLRPGSRGGSVELVDMAGRRVKVNVPVKRAVVLSVSTLEVIHVIGGDGQVVAVPAEAKLDPLLPAQVRGAPVVGSRLRLTDWEKALSLKPDLIVDLDLEAFYDVKGLVDRAASYGIPVLLLREDRLSDIPATARMLGRVFGREREAERFASFFEEQVREVRGVAAKIPVGERRSVVMIQPIFGKLYVVNGNDVLAEAVRLVGADYMVNVTLHGYTPVRIPMDREKIVSSYRDADVIILLTSTVTPIEKVEALKKEMASDPLWRQVKAVREGRVYVLRADLGQGSYLRWSPRLAVGIWQLGSTIYPEYFPDWRGKAGLLDEFYGH